MFGEIEQRAPTAGAKMWRLCVCFTGKIAAKPQTAGIKFTHRPKSAFLPRRGYSLHRFSLNLAQPRGTWVRLPCKISRQKARGWEHGPKMAKISCF